MEKRIKIFTDIGNVFAYESKEGIPLKKGIYKIKLSVKESWIGYNENYNYLVLKKDSFLKLSGESDMKESNSFKKGCVLSVGGDGTFNVTVKVTKVKKITTNPFKDKLEKAKKFWKGRDYSDSLNERYFKTVVKGSADYKLTGIADKKRASSLNKRLLRAKRILKKLRIVVND